VFNKPKGETMKAIFIAAMAAISLAACDVSKNKDFDAKQTEALKQQADLEAYCKDPVHEQEEKCKVNKDVQKP
jgi:hypothetical protein